MWFSGFLKEKLSFCKYIPVVNFLYYMIDVSRPYVCGLPQSGILFCTAMEQDRIGWRVAHAVK